MTRRKQKAATTTAVAATAAVNSSADDDEEALTTMQSHPRLVRIMEEANYEAYVDPYRGIVPFFSVPFNNNNKNNEANYLDGSCGGRGGGEAIIGMQSPWIQCAPVLQQQQTQDAPFSWKFERLDVDGGNNSSSDKTDESNTVLLVQFGCPTIDSWAMDHWRKYQQKMKRENKKSNNNKNGKGGGGGNNDNGGSGKETKKHKDDADLDDITDRSCNGDDIECKIPILICGTSGGECCPCDFNPVRYRFLF